MVSKKFVTLSALVLVFAVIATNAGKTSGANEGSNAEKEMEMSVFALCVSCPDAQSSVNEFKKCLSDNGAAQAVSAATGNDTMQCVQSVISKAETLNLDVKKLVPCLQKLVPAKAALTKCFKDAKVPAN